MTDSQEITPLHLRQCQHRNSKADRLGVDEMQFFLEKIVGWSIKEKNDLKLLSKQYQVKNFDAALALAHEIGKLADEQDHHPQLLVEWGKLRVNWWTHSVGGLSENDFIMAARLDQLFNEK